MGRGAMADITAHCFKKSILAAKAREVILREDNAWQSLRQRLVDAFTKAWRNQSARGLSDLLDVLRELRDRPINRKMVDILMDRLRLNLGSEAMAGALNKPVVSLSDLIFRVGAKEPTDSASISINWSTLSHPDREALNLVTDGNWVANSWNTFTDKLFRDALDDYFREGMTRYQLAERFTEDFRGLTQRGQVYWEMLADHAATKTREIGRVSGYQRATVTKVQIRAHIDHRTTPRCRSLHGRVIEVSTLVRSA